MAFADIRLFGTDAVRGGPASLGGPWSWSWAAFIPERYLMKLSGKNNIITVAETMDRKEFLIPPHPQVREYSRRGASDLDRWLGGTRRLRNPVLR